MDNINNYLPKILQPILEFQVINGTLTKELQNIDKLIDGIQKEVIITTAGTYGIDRWEKALNIIPGIDDSLDIRKFRIQNILNSKLPYTIKWLKNKLTEIVGNDSGWVLNVDYNTYKITIILSGLNIQLMKEVQKQLRKSIPANMVLEIGGEPITSSDILLGIGTHIAYKIKINSDFTIE